MELEMSIKEKMDNLIYRIGKMDKAIVAFSGGIDSSFLLNTAVDVLGNRVTAVTCDSDIFPIREISEARDFVRGLGIEHMVIRLDMFNVEEFTINLPERCYFCKKQIFGAIKKIADEMGVDNILEGHNIDDMDDYRPGRKALKELGIVSPLKDAGLTKAEIRILSRERGISFWDKPASPCLATRIPYGVKIIPEKISTVDKAEEFIHHMGIKHIRVRHHGNIARLETNRECLSVIMTEENRMVISEKLRSLGFEYITVDIECYRTGSMNRSIKKGDQ